MLIFYIKYLKSRTFEGSVQFIFLYFKVWNHISDNISFLSMILRSKIVTMNTNFTLNFKIHGIFYYIQYIYLKTAYFALILIILAALKFICFWEHKCELFNNSY